MALALSAGAFCFGFVLHRLGSLGVDPGRVFGAAALLFIAAEMGLVFDLPVSPKLLWSAIAAFGAGTVFAYTITARTFPRGSIGRANTALNLLHFGAAFVVQSMFGTVVSWWPRNSLGQYPPEAYKTALLLLAVTQLLAAVWFFMPIPSREQPRSPNLNVWRFAAALLTCVVLAAVLRKA
jgi:hypothetical protein